MTTEAQTTGPARTPVTQRYLGTSRVHDEAIQLVTDSQRTAVRARGTVHDPIALREALSVLHEIVRSDLRYKPKDRSAYMAYQRMKKQSVGLTGLKAQQAYFDWLARNDPTAFLVLDPVVTVHPEHVLFEVFSKDEGTYASLSLSKEALAVDGAWTCGTTNVDFSDALYDGVQRLRSYRPATLAVGPDAVSLASDGEEVVEKRIEVPDAWLRGFLQVQSSATLARATVDLQPIELYNLLRQLRMNADQKRKGRAIRVELVPGEAPRLVLEPWEWVLNTTSGNYAGTKPEIVRIWGRRRWMMVRRFLPFVTSARLHLLGSGLPSFLVLSGEHLTLTLGLTGFTSANWSRSLQLDQLLPRGGGTAKLQKKVTSVLTKAWALPMSELVAQSKAERDEVTAVLQGLGQQGQVMFDLAHDVVRLRPLTAESLTEERLAYRNDRERQAHDLLAAKAVKVTKEEVVHGTGTQLVATVKVAADKREYRTSFLLDDEGRVRKAECTCHFFRTHGLKEGPCPHLVALRLRHAELLEARAKRRGGAITAETRTYARRTAEGEAVTQLAFAKRTLKVRWGQRTDARLRVQNLVFDTVEDARTAYLGRIERLEATGWLDASTS